MVQLLLISGIRKFAILGAATAGLIAVGGCSSDKVRDAFGLSKDAPNENLVRVNRPLALPPDYVLRAPNTGQPPREPGYTPAPAPKLATQLPAPGSMVAPPVQRAAPYNPAVGGQPPLQGAGAGVPLPQQGPLQTAQPVQIANAQPGQQPYSQPAKPKDIYERWGVSKTNPDGTPKSPKKLREELRAKYLAKKRAGDPKWGTWKNFWNGVFGDD